MGCITHFNTNWQPADIFGTPLIFMHKVSKTTVEKPYQFNSKSFSKYHDVRYPTSKSNDHP